MRKIIILKNISKFGFYAWTLFLIWKWIKNYFSYEQKKAKMLDEHFKMIFSDLKLYSKKINNLHNKINFQWQKIKEIWKKIK